MTEVVRLAPAKLNLTLEVLGRRAGGYHEIRSVMATAGLYDTVTVGPGSGTLITAAETYDQLGLPAAAGEENTVDVALRLIASVRAERELGRRLPAGDALAYGLARVALRLHKQIPAAAGLGGGSSDGVQALLALNEFWRLSLGDAGCVAMAAAIGSDCPFFVHGGIQRVSGRGEITQPLPAPPPAWFCLVRPPVALPRKTARLYALLTPEMMTDGSRTDRLAQRLLREPATPLRAEELCNVFDGVADRAFGGLNVYRDALRATGAEAVHLCGAGPALYGFFREEAACQAACAALRAAGYQSWSVRVPA